MLQIPGSLWYFSYKKVENFPRNTRISFPVFSTYVYDKFGFALVYKDSFLSGKHRPANCTLMSVWSLQDKHTLQVRKQNKPNGKSTVVLTKYATLELFLAHMEPNTNISFLSVGLLLHLPLSKARAVLPCCCVPGHLQLNHTTMGFSMFLKNKLVFCVCILWLKLIQMYMVTNNCAVSPSIHISRRRRNNTAFFNVRYLENLFLC